jgi:TIR domain
MDVYFVSFDGRDRNIAVLVVDVLRRNNPAKTFFWTGDSLVGGRSWFARIENSLRDAKGIICLITNNRSGTNNWINFEVGAAIGGRKNRIIIVGPGIGAPMELSKPLQELQYIGWSDRVALKRELKRAKLASSTGAVEELVSALEPPKITSCSYGEGGNWYEYSRIERGRFATSIENLKEIIIGNHLIGDRDPSPGYPKVLRVEIERAGERYIKSFDEGATVYRGDLW